MTSRRSLVLVPVVMVLILALQLWVAHTTDANSTGSLEQQLGQLQVMANALQEQVTALRVQNRTLQTQVNELQVQAASLTTITQYMSLQAVNGQPTVRFSGVNVQVVNGQGNTWTVNGTGNLIVGYDEPDSGDYRCTLGMNPNTEKAVVDETTCVDAGGSWTNTAFKTGSHYLVVGPYNNYSRWGGLIAGYGNVSNYDYASVLGGYRNTASGFGSSVSGGSSNIASGNYSSVSGGSSNTASGNSSSVLGAFNKDALANYQTIPHTR